jgi:hypothetical protein
MRARSIAATTLVVLACVLAPLSVTAIWVDRTVYDTDGYVAAVGPLARNAAIQHAIVQRTVTAIDRQLERQLDGDAGPVRRLVNEQALDLAHDAARRAATTIVESERFEQLWERLNREGHERALAWFSGDSDRVKAGVEDDRLVVSLQPLVEQVADRIDGLGVGGFELSGDRIRKLDPEVVLVDGPLVGPVQQALRTLHALAPVLAVLTALAVIGALVVAPDRRRALARLGLGLLIAMGVALVALKVGRSEFLAWIDTTSVSVPASTAFFDILVRGLRDALLIGLVLGAGVALAARFAGGRGKTVATSPDSIGTFLAAHIAGATVVVVLAGLGVLLVLPRPTPLSVLVVGILATGLIVGLRTSARHSLRP